MSIRDRQIADAEAKALQSELQAGRYPELTTIQRMIAGVFAKAPAGLPQFQLTSLKNDQVSNPDDINQMLEQILADITTGFSEVVSLEGIMMGMANYYETEKNKVDKKIAKVFRRIDSITEKMKYRTQSNVITKRFHDFLDIEMTGDESRNLPATTVLVDLLKGVATLDKIKQGTVRYDIADAKMELRVNGTPLSTRTSGELTHILKDAVNAAWRYVVETNTVNPVTITLKLSLEKPLAVTTVGFLAESPAATSVTLYISEDDVTYVKQGTKSLTGMGLWNIPLATVRYIKLELMKEEPDATKGTSSEFEFGASRIILQRETYQAEGKLVSAAIPVGEIVVDRIQVTPVESKLPGTNIRYYTAIDDGVSPLEWAEANTEGTVHYDAYKTFRSVIDKDSVGYSTPVDPPQFGNQNYALVNLGVTPVAGATKLYAGEQMWQVDSIAGPPPVTPLVVTGPVDFNRPYATAYYDLKKTFSGSQMILAQGWTRMTIEFQIDTDQMPFVQRLQVNPEAIVAVYLNNTLLGGVKQGDGFDYTYKFTAGLNKVVIYVYSPVGGHIAPNLDLMLRASWARASSKPLTEVSLYNLYNNTSVKDASRFAWKNNTLVVNYAPQGVRYWLETKYTLQDAVDTKVRFMAIFNRTASASDASAQLSQYQLVVK